MNNETRAHDLSIELTKVYLAALSENTQVEQIEDIINNRVNPSSKLSIFDVYEKSYENILNKLNRD
ncbi:hypothetical protein ACPBEH_05170 [Latilactobacillus sp. 5-91]|uniref:hypothetical protein n=1 Tax=Latilactobacillus sp. 5-91 TaxID=3410924 RepID=UPI003C711378